MRTLNLNKTTLWVVRVTGYTDHLDINGHKTGEKIPSFSVPEEIQMSLYPTNGMVDIVEMGMMINGDYYAVSNEVSLTERDLLFNSEPVSDYDKTYDYTVEMILSSLNTHRYILKGRD